MITSPLWYCCGTAAVLALSTTSAMNARISRVFVGFIRAYLFINKGRKHSSVDEYTTTTAVSGTNAGQVSYILLGRLVRRMFSWLFFVNMIVNMKAHRVSIRAGCEKW